jgi:DNA-binding GntR family transcriptional regulator
MDDSLPVGDGRVMPIERVGHSFSDQVERALREQILRGHYRPGARLNEGSIATELGVSRGPVREAMQRLARDGLVELRVHRGAFVRRLDPGQVRDLFEVRIALESCAARLAAERATAEQSDRLRLLLSVEAGEASAELHADERFLGERDLHIQLAEAAHNSALTAYVASVNQELRLLRAHAGEVRDRADHAASEHSRILEAVLTGDGEGAAAAMAAHLEKALELALVIVAGD